MADVSVEQIANEMFEMVKRDAGVKKYKPGDLTKAMKNKYGVEKDVCKEAIKELVNNGRLVYTYYGGSWLEVPHREGAAND